MAISLQAVGDPAVDQNFRRLATTFPISGQLIRHVTIEEVHIVKESISTALLAAEAVTAAKIKAGTITAGLIEAEAITTTLLHAEAVTAAKIKANTIEAGQIKAGTITATQIAAATIEAGNIKADTITAGQIAAEAITTSELAADSVTSAKIAAGTIVSGDIAAGGVTAGNITVATLSALSADLGTITAGTVTGATLQTAAEGKRVVIDTAGLRAYDGGGKAVLDFSTETGNLKITGAVEAGSTIPATTITGSIIEEQIAKEAVGTEKIKAEAVTAAKIKALTIEAGQIAANAITATKIAAEAVESSHIKANTIVAGDIAATTITATQIAAETITGAKIAASTITASKLSVETLSAITANLGTVTAGTINGTTINILEDQAGSELAPEEHSRLGWEKEGKVHTYIVGTVLGAGETSALFLTANATNSRKSGQLGLTAFNEKAKSTESAALQCKALVGSRLVQVFADGIEKRIFESGEKSDFLQLPATAKRIVRFGYVSSAGAKEAGEGFKSEKTATGVYEITMEPALAQTGVIVITTQLAFNWRVSVPSKTTFTVETFSGLGTAEDSGFHFHVI